MGISSFGRSITDDWELITTSSPSAQTTVTLSSIATIYSKLLVTIDVTNPGNTAGVTLTINNSSTDYMSLGYTGFVNATVGYPTSPNKTGHIVTVSASYSQTANYGLVLIDSANTAGGKYIKSFGTATGGTSGTSTMAEGFWGGTTAIDRLDLTGPTMTGTVKLYGVRL